MPKYAHTPLTHMRAIISKSIIKSHLILHAYIESVPVSFF